MPNAPCEPRGILHYALCSVSDRDDPMMAHIERQLVVQPIEEHEAVLIQERHESDRAFLGVAMRKGERARMGELAPQGVVAPFRRLDQWWRAP